MRNFFVLVSLSEESRTVNTAVKSGYFARRCSTAGMARELLAPVRIIVPVMVGLAVQSLTVKWRRSVKEGSSVRLSESDSQPTL